MHHKYCIIGGGLAAAAAIDGIRQYDKTGSILMLTRENHLPYQRPPLTKELWYGTLELGRLPVHADGFYEQNGVEVSLRHDIEEIDVDAKVLWDERGDSYGYDELLIATGCRPKRLRAEGADIPTVRYFRDLEDYLDLESRMDRFQHVTIVGGGFTAVEMTAALRSRGKEVTLIFPEEYPLHRFLPRSIGVGLVEFLREEGVETVSGDTLVHLEERGGYVYARTYNGNELTTQLVLVDNGGEPLSDLADAAGLDTDDGIVVNEYGQCSKPHVWAAGDVAEFPYLALGQLRRVEGSDHAEQHGRLVGANMAGAGLVYSHLPLKWFRVGELQFEGVGELDSRLDHEEIWLEPGREGVIFYLRDDVIRGVLLVNVHARLDWARQLVIEGRAMSPAERSGLLTPQV